MMRKNSRNWIQMLRLTSRNRSHDLPSSPDFFSPPRPLLQRPRICSKKKKPPLMSRRPSKRRSPRPRLKQLRRLPKPRKRGHRHRMPPNMHLHRHQKPGGPLDPPTSYLQTQLRSSAPARRVRSTRGFGPRSTQTDRAQSELLQSRYPQPPPRELDPRCHKMICSASVSCPFFRLYHNSFFLFRFLLFFFFLWRTQKRSKPVRLCAILVVN